jgi:hypothetical protein
MTTRERFNTTLHWRKPDRIPNMEFGYWEQTLKLWQQSGLPDFTTGEHDYFAPQIQAEKYFGLAGLRSIPWLPVKNEVYPAFPLEVLEDLGSHQIIRDKEGNVCEVSKSDVSIPRFIKYAIETPSDWQTYKRERLDYTRADRIGDVEGVVREAHAQGMPVRMHVGSLYGYLRNWMGVENLSIALMTARGWVEEMMDHLMHMQIYLIEKSLPGVEIDIAWWWEDMCYNQGPLLSPELFEALMVPRYKCIAEVLRGYGVDVNLLDCDGRIFQLVPGWLKAGINCMFPVESAHTDPLALREVFGESLLMVGGVNKRAISKGRDSIDRELERLQPLAESGGYIPTFDHLVPPDVSLENYRYYLEEKEKILL